MIPKRARQQPDLEPDLNMAKRFLQELDPDAEAWTFQTYDDSGNGNRKLARVLHGALAEHVEILTDLNRRGAAVAVTMNKTDLKGTKKENIQHVRAVMADLDDAPLDPVWACRLKPHCIVETSPGRHHVYWWLDKKVDVTREEFEDVQRSIAKRFDGDPNVALLTHRARLPGFFHCKTEPFRVHIVRWNAHAPFKADDIHAEFPPEAKPHKPGKSGKAKNTKPPKQADVLVALAEATTVLFHNVEGTGYADLTVAEHRETVPIRSKALKGWLTKQFYEHTDTAPNSEAMTAALSLIEAKAQFDGERCEVFLRVAALDNCLYLDLCNELWQAVEITPTGWSVIDDPPVRFVRRKGMEALPTPVSGGTHEALLDYLNLATESDLVLVVAWLVAALRPHEPYPVLVVTGEAGSAKSTGLRVLRDLIDPNTAPLRAKPKDDRDVFIAASNSYVVALDNLSDLPAWLSDDLSRLATEGGFATRQLYTDDEERLFKAMRPVLLGSIEDVVIRGDLADRSLFLRMPTIPEENRRLERELWADFGRDYPRILGALLTAVAAGLKALPTVHLDKTPRMADFFEWGVATESALWPPGTFATAYERNRKAAAADLIAADLVADAIQEFMRSWDEWNGELQKLYAELNEMVPDSTRNARKWPKAAHVLSGRLRAAAPQLRKIGIEVIERRGAKTKRRLIGLKHVSPPK